MAKVPFIIHATTKGINSANNKIGKLSGTMKGLTVAAGATAVAMGAMGLGRVLANIGKSSVDTAAQFEMLKVRLNVMYGSVQRGTQAFKAFNDVAATTPFQLQNVVEAGVSLKAFGADAEEMIKPISDLAAFMGVDVVDAASAFGRAFAGGAGAADMLKERGVLPLIASFSGIEDLTKLTIPEFRDVMEKALTDPNLGIAGMTTEVAGTWIGMVSNFQDGVERIKAAIGDELLNELKPRLAALNAELSKIGEIGWDNIIKSIKKNWDITQKIIELTVFAGGQIIGLALVEGWVFSLSKFMPRVGDVVFSQFHLLFTGIEMLQEKLGLPVSKNTEALNDFIDSVPVLNTKIVDLTSDFGEEIAAIMTKLDKDTQLLLQTILSGAAAAKAAKGDPTEDAKEQVKANKIVGASDDELTKKKIENAAKGAQTARAGIQSAIRGHIMEGVAGYAAKALASFPPPLNLILAGAAGGLVNELITSMINQIGAPKMSFATGGSFVTSGPESILVGDNPSGQELVTVTPLDTPDEDIAGGGSININISGNVMSEGYTEDVIIPQIRSALERGASL